LIKKKELKNITKDLITVQKKESSFMKKYKKKLKEKLNKDKPKISLSAIFKGKK
jgi:hypothetical protein